MTPNAEHYHDPTADKAVKSVDREKKMLTLKIDEEAVGPIRWEGRAGFSLFTPRDVYIGPHSRAAVDIGLNIQLPTRSVGIIKGTQRLLVESGLLVPDVTIGEGQEEKIKVVLINTTDKRLNVKKRTEIAELIIQPVLYPSIAVKV